MLTTFATGRFLSAARLENLGTLSVHSLESPLPDRNDIGIDYNSRLHTINDLGSDNMFRNLFFKTLVLGLIAAGPVSTICADDWPQWLGPGRDGVWNEEGILDQFPEDGPTLKWKVPIAGGYCGPAVANGKVFVCDWVETKSDDDPKSLHKGQLPRNPNFIRRLKAGTERVLCLDEKTGQILWEHKYDCPYTSAGSYAIGPRATPTVDGKHVYTVGTEGHLFCLNVEDGSVVWSKQYQEDYGVELPTWGFAAPPLVHGDKLICIVGGAGTTCVAFDKLSGKEIWRALSSEKPGYSAPVMRKIGEHEQLILWSGESIHGLDAETGKEFWSVPFESTYGMSVATPQTQGRWVFAMCFSQKSTLIEVAKDGQSAKHVWEATSGTGIDGVHNTAMLDGDHVYGCGNGGRYICAKLSSGERVWSSFQPASAKRPISWGNVFTIRNGSRVFLANDHGELIIAKLSPQGYEEISRAQLIEPTHQVGSRRLVWSHPAFANRNVYVRNDKEIRCYSLAAEE